MVKYEFNGKNELKGLILTCISSAFIVCFIGIIQFFQGTAVSNRITSTMDNSNNLAAFIILLIFPTIMISICERKNKKGLIYGFITIVFFIALFMTGSRNSIIGLGMGILVLVILYNKKLLYLFGGLTGIALLIPSISSRIREIFDFSQNSSRIKLWKTAMQMIKDNPILGVGNGNYVSRYGEYIERFPELEYSGNKVSASHNSYLKVQSELGILGEVTFVILLVTILYRVRNIRKLLKDEFLKFFCIGYTASIVSFYLMNMFDNLFFVPKTTTSFWLLIAVVEALGYNKSETMYEDNILR